MVVHGMCLETTQVLGQEAVLLAAELPCPLMEALLSTLPLQPRLEVKARVVPDTLLPAMGATLLQPMVELKARMAGAVAPVLA